MRRERGTLIASGFIAGGALMGVISAVLKYAGQIGMLPGAGQNGWPLSCMSLLSVTLSGIR